MVVNGALWTFFAITWSRYLPIHLVAWRTAFQQPYTG